jgi:hypothetical protein
MHARVKKLNPHANTPAAAKMNEEVKDLTFFPSAVVFAKTYFTFLPSRANRQIHSEYKNVLQSLSNKTNRIFLKTTSKRYYYHVWEGYLRKIPVERRNISRAEWRGEFSLKTGIFGKYPSQT